MTEPTRRSRSVREDEDVGRRQNYRRLAENRIRVQETLQGAYDDLDDEVNPFANNEIIEEPIADINMEEGEERIIFENFQKKEDDGLEDYYSIEDYEGENESDINEGENDLFEDPYGDFEQIEQQQRQAGFQDELVQWVLSCSVTKSAVTDLLKLLRSQEHLSFLKPTRR